MSFGQFTEDFTVLVLQEDKVVACICSTCLPHVCKSSDHNKERLRETSGCELVTYSEFNEFSLNFNADSECSISYPRTLYVEISLFCVGEGQERQESPYPAQH